MPHKLRKLPSRRVYFFCININGKCSLCIFLGILRENPSYAPALMKANQCVSVEGYRQDGRGCEDPRAIIADIGVLREADGSCAFSIGNTRALAAVYGPKNKSSTTSGANHFQDEETGMRISCTATISGMATGAAMRGGGDASFCAHYRSDQRSPSLEQLIIDSLRPLIFAKQYPQSLIAIHVQVLQDDGGAEAAALNAVSIALQEASISMRDICIACAVATAGRNILADPTRREVNLSSGDVLYVASAHDKDGILSLKMNRKTNEMAMNTVLHACAGACEVIAGKVKAALRSFYEGKLQKDVPME